MMTFNVKRIPNSILVRIHGYGVNKDTRELKMDVCDYELETMIMTFHGIVKKTSADIIFEPGRECYLKVLTPDGRKELLVHKYEHETGSSVLILKSAELKQLIERLEKI